MAEPQPNMADGLGADARDADEAQPLLSVGGPAVQASDDGAAAAALAADAEAKAKFNQKLANAEAIKGILGQDRSFWRLGLDDFIRPVLALFGLALLPVWLVLFSWNSLGKRPLPADPVVHIDDADEDEEQQLIDTLAKGVVNVVHFVRAGVYRFDELYRNPHQFRRSFAYLMAFIYAAVQGVVIVAAMLPFLGASLSIAGIPLFLSVGAFAMATTLVNYNLAISFMVKLFTTNPWKDWRLNWALKQSWSATDGRWNRFETVAYWALLLIVATGLSAAAAGIMGALTWHVLHGLVASGGLLAGAGPLAAMIPGVGAGATAFAYFVMFFCDVRGLIHSHWKGDQTLKTRIYNAYRWMVESPKEFVLSLIIGAAVLVGLFLTIYVGMGDMVRDFNVSVTVAETLAAINFLGAGIFFSTGAAGMASYMSRLARSFTSRDADGRWRIVRYFEETFMAKRIHGYALYQAKDGFYRRDTNGVFVKMHVHSAKGDQASTATTPKLVMVGYGIMFARAVMYLWPLVMVGSTVALLTGVALPLLPLSIAFAALIASKFMVSRANNYEREQQRQAIVKHGGRALSDDEASLLDIELESQYLKHLQTGSVDQGCSNGEVQARMIALVAEIDQMRSKIDYTHADRVDKILAVIDPDYQDVHQDAPELTGDTVSRADTTTAAGNALPNAVLPAGQVSGVMSATILPTASLGSFGATARSMFSEKAGVRVDEADRDVVLGAATAA